MIGLLVGACGRGSISSRSEGWSSVETSAASLTGGIPVRCDLFLLNWPVGVCTKEAVTVPGTLSPSVDTHTSIPSSNGVFGHVQCR